MPDYRHTPLFGYSFDNRGKFIPPTLTPQKPYPDNVAKSFAPPEEEDGAVQIYSGSHYGSYIDLDGSVRTSVDQIKKYREMSLHHEVESSVQDICDEAIIFEDSHRPVDLDLSSTDLPPKIQKVIQEEFKGVLKLLKFNTKGYETFRRWYVDGRLFFHKIVDEKDPKNGIIELRPLDAIKVKKIRNIKKKRLETTYAEDIQDAEEFFLYTDDLKTNSATMTTIGSSLQGVKISTDAICFVSSGLFDPSRKKVLSYLQKAQKPLNQLRMIEDASVIYRLARAPERRVFYVDVGNLPKGKAEQYLKEIMNRHRQKLVYDVATGEMRDDKRHMTMLEDFWMPRREGGKGTEVSTLPGGQNLGEMGDVEYFNRKLLTALHIPQSRQDTSKGGFNMGRAAEISRDELKFFKFVERLRRKFSELFLDILRTQLILKGLATQEEWNQVVDDIRFVYRKNSVFTEQKETEVIQGRMQLLAQVDSYIGKYFDKTFAFKKILRMSDEEVQQIKTGIEQDKQEMADQGIDPMSTGYSVMGAGQTILPAQPAAPTPLDQQKMAAQAQAVENQAKAKKEEDQRKADLEIKLAKMKNTGEKK